MSEETKTSAEGRKYCRKLASYCLVAGLLPLFICNTNHYAFPVGHLFGYEPLSWGFLNDVIWTSAFSAAAVFAVRSVLKRRWLFAVCAFLAIPFGLIGAVLLSAPLLLVAILIAVRSRPRHRGARVRMPCARARRDMHEKTRPKTHIR